MSTPGTGYVRRVTKETLSKFRKFLRTGSEPAAESPDEKPVGQEQGPGEPASPSPGPLTPESGTGDSPFGGGTPVTIPYQHRAHQSSGITNQTNQEAPTPAQPSVTADHTVFREEDLLWRKLLSATDAQRQPGNATGDLRLTQAAFEVDGKRINQTTYFRESVFAGANWTAEGNSEITEITFFISIFGHAFGNVPLIVSHKPSGEAGQGNYTTNIRWGTLGSQLRDTHNVTGALLRLYQGGPTNEAQFSIIIS